MRLRTEDFKSYRRREVENLLVTHLYCRKMCEMRLRTEVFKSYRREDGWKPVGDPYLLQEDV